MRLHVSTSAAQFAIRIRPRPSTICARNSPTGVTPRRCNARSMRRTWRRSSCTLGRKAASTPNCSTIELQSADAIENSASQAAPGSAPFLTATAITSGIHAQALTQKLLAAELRQEAARIAHRNTLRKENATNTTQLRGVLVNLLQHQ